MAIQRHGAGPRMSAAVVHGNTVYLAGMVAEDPSKDITEQTKSVLSRIDAGLKSAGTDKSKLLSAQIFITDMRNFQDMNAVWDAWVDKGNTPARATVQASLANPKMLVEIMVVAAGPPAGFPQPASLAAPGYLGNRGGPGFTPGPERGGLGGAASGPPPSSRT